MKLFYLTVLFVLPYSTPLLNNAPKEWVKEQDHINGRIPRGKLVKMQNAAEAMISFLRDSCFSNTDFNPLWHGEYAIGAFGIQCRSEDNKGRLSIMSNDIAPLLRYLTVNGKEFAGIRPPATSKDDYYQFEYEEEDRSHTTFWLVTTAHDQLPYTAITRREYLQEAHAELTARKNNIIAAIKLKTPVRSAAVQAAEKKAAIDELNNNYSGADLQVRIRLFNRDYRSDEDYLRENIEKATASLNRTLRLTDSLYTHSTAADLGKPAMVSVEATNFHGFEDNQTDRNMLVKINPAYYHTSSGNESERPLHFLVSWSYDPAGPTASDIDRQIRENIDFRQLRTMLGQ